jgi:hypothetical protein
LDVACGANPFPKADVVCDLNVLLKRQKHETFRNSQVNRLFYAAAIFCLLKMERFDLLPAISA